jgi:riboflavin biosynthesis pyrimidine reductase
MPRMGDLDEPWTNLDTRESPDGIGFLTANAYLGGEAVTAALSSGADVVITGRITDASLVVGPAAWWHGWSYADAAAGDTATLDRIAGAVVAGHAIECGAQVTGGNYSFFERLPGMEHVGFPLAEVAADGSSVITKHPGTGGAVTVGTVTAQLLYEIGGAAYANPDATARFDSMTLNQDGPDRVRISDVRGETPPERLKVAANYLGGFRNSMTLVITGLDAQAKADLALRTITGLSLTDSLEPGISAATRASRSALAVRELDIDWSPATGEDPASTADAQSLLRLTVRDMGVSRQPLRIVFDSRLSHAPTSRLGQSARQTPVWMVHTVAAPEAARTAWAATGATLIEVDASPSGQVDPSSALHALAARGLTRILCEGGGQLAASLVTARLIDDLATYHAGALIGADGRPALAALGLKTLAEVPRLTLRESQTLGGDAYALWSCAFPNTHL